MFGKIKYISIGLVIGIVISSATIGIGATVTKYTLTKSTQSVKINNKTYTNKPVLKYGTTTYLPIDTITKDALNMVVTSDTKKNLLSITPEAPITKEIIYTEENGIGNANIDNIDNVCLDDISKHYNLPFDIENNIVSIYKNKSDQYNNKPLKTEIPHSKLKNDTYISKSYYTSTLYPVILINSSVAIDEENAKKKTPDGLQINYIEGNQYIRLIDIHNKYYFIERSKKTYIYKIDTNPLSTGKISLYRIEKMPDKILLLSNIPYKETCDELGNKDWYVDYNFYVNTILPHFI